MIPKSCRTSCSHARASSVSTPTSEKNKPVRDDFGQLIVDLLSSAYAQNKGPSMATGDKNPVDSPLTLEDRSTQYSPGCPFTYVWCRDSILYRLVLAYFTTHDDWASQRNITIMCRVIPHIMCSFPAITRQTQDTFPHSRNAFPALALSAHSCASSCSCVSPRFIAHLRILAHLRISPQFSAHHHRSIHPLSSQFLGASHSIYYYIWLCLALYD